MLTKIFDAYISLAYDYGSSDRTCKNLSTTAGQSAGKVKARYFFAVIYSAMNAAASSSEPN